MKLTYGYVENKYAKVSAYFCSYLFGADRTPGPIKSFSGEHLSIWLRDKLITQGFDVADPTPDSIGWTFPCVVQDDIWDILCENIRFNDDVIWKLSISSKDIVKSAEDALPLANTIKAILCNEPSITDIDWNREIFNCESDKTTAAAPDALLVY